MKNRLAGVGIGMLVFGLVNLFSYVPISLGVALQSRPFPFEHIRNVIHIEGKGTSIETGYLPINEAINDPYWLVWSLVLYGGIVILSIVGIRMIRK